MDLIKFPKRLLFDGKYTLVAINGNSIYFSDKHGIRTLLDPMRCCPDFFKGAVIADRIIGKSAALLMIKGGIKEVYAEIISKHAMKVFEKFGIPFSYGHVTEYVVNRAKDGMCPMEKSVLDTDDPECAFTILIETLNNLS